MSEHPFVLTEAKQVRALVSPARSQILEILGQGGAKSVAELAKAIDASGPATQYHVAQLVDVGLVVRAGKRRTGPRSESLYRSVSDKILVPSRSKSPEYMEALLDMALATIRKLEKELVAAHTAPSQEAEAPRVVIKSRSGSVRAADVSRLTALLDEALTLVHPRGADGGKELFSLRTFLIKLPAE